MKTICLFIGFCLGFIALVFSEEIKELPVDVNTIAIANAQSYPDSIVQLELDIENYEEFVAFQIDLLLPDGLDYIEDSEQLTSRAQDHLIQVDYIGDDSLRIISFSMNSMPFLGNSGAVATIEFYVNLDEGLYELVLENGLLADINSNNILDEMINGSLEVLPITKKNNENISSPKFILTNNIPNPFNPSTRIDYALPADSDVELSIYNIKGKLVKRIKQKDLPAGYQHIYWYGRDSNNKRVASGVYFYRLKAGKHQKTKKMLLMK